MRNIFILLVALLFTVCLHAQTDNAERAKIKADIEKLNKEMEDVFNANDMAATAAFIVMMPR